MVDNDGFYAVKKEAHFWEWIEIRECDAGTASGLAESEFY